MSGAGASSAVRARVRRDDAALGGGLRVLLVPATVLTVLGMVVLLLFTPLYMHPALELAGAPAAVGLALEVARSYSDRTVAELLFGPATFAFAAPDGTAFYDAAEIAHLRDVRLVLYTFLVVAAAAASVLFYGLWRGRHDPAVLRSVAAGGGVLAIATGGLAVFAALAFSLAFELFHRIFFPGGNWAFDPTTQRLVQLYPLAFWQLTAAALAVLLVGGGLAIWWLARRRARALAGRNARGRDAT